MKSHLKKIIQCLVTTLFLLTLLAACQDNDGITLDSLPGLTTQTAAAPSDTPVPTFTFTPSPTFTPSATPVVILDPDPIDVTFMTEDGKELSGLYYPASENPAPVIVLLHWAQGDLTEWDPIALWLQNRGQLNRTPDFNDSWKSSDWFPENKMEGSLGVFVFTLRNCEGGCQFYQPAEWLLDIEAAMRTAAQLQGVDKTKILTAGASIGADGALYGCAWINKTGTGKCLGSYSLSPASLLTIPYDQLVGEVIAAEPPSQVYCLYGLRDDASVETCSGLTEIHTVDYGYIENHGLELFQSVKPPDPLDLLIEFIEISISGVGE